jgi:ATP-dependent protease ClpP protease subunit
MFHTGTSNVGGEGHRKITEAWLQAEKETTMRIDAIVYQRMLERNSNLTRKQYDKLNMFDTILFPEQAIELGLIDGVYTK